MSADAPCAICLEESSENVLYGYCSRCHGCRVHRDCMQDYVAHGRLDDTMRAPMALCADITVSGASIDFVAYRRHLHSIYGAFEWLMSRVSAVYRRRWHEGRFVCSLSKSRLERPKCMWCRQPLLTMRNAQQEQQCAVIDTEPACRSTLYYFVYLIVRAVILTLPLLYLCLFYTLFCTVKNGSDLGRYLPIGAMCLAVGVCGAESCAMFFDQLWRRYCFLETPSGNPSHRYDLGVVSRRAIVPCFRRAHAFWSSVAEQALINWLLQRRVNYIRARFNEDDAWLAHSGRMSYRDAHQVDFLPPVRRINVLPFTNETLGTRTRCDQLVCDYDLISVFGKNFLLHSVWCLLTMQIVYGTSGSAWTFLTLHVWWALQFARYVFTLTETLVYDTVRLLALPGALKCDSAQQRRHLDALSKLQSVYIVPFSDST